MSDTQGNIAPTIYDYVTMSIVLPTYLKFECFSEVFRGFTGFTRFYQGFTRFKITRLVKPTKSTKRF